MSDFDEKELRRELDVIVKEYLLNISSLKNHDYFREKKVEDSRATYFNNTGFGIFSGESENSYVVMEEMFLDGCTRVFLINPIIKTLLDFHKIDNDWQFGSTFANFKLSNREYEMGSFLEFIAVLDGKRIGIRYTRTSYSSEERCVMERNQQVLLGKEKIPGFDKLSPIDEVFVLDWSGIEEDELSKIHPILPGLKKLTKDISIKKFFENYFSNEEFEIVISVINEAITCAKNIIALRAVPQLLPNNMLDFKQVILTEFTEKNMELLSYEFEDNTVSNELGMNDLKIIKDTFFASGYRDSLVGEADFAKSFITSEYLFRIVKEGLSIDYTAVVVGYLKAIEQLLYLLYVSAFEGSAKMVYWDRCNITKYFDSAKKDKYRYDPYNLDKEWMQEKYSHYKKTGDNAPEIGELTRFLRYYEKMWSISEDAKEYVFKCLEDFRGSCRNAHFHKDNINAAQYDTVKRIRKNTHVCLFYLLGGFKFLDSSSSVKSQLGIINYRFEMLYQEIRQKRRRFFEVKFSDGSQGIICYLNEDKNVAFSESGTLMNAELKFVKINMTVDTAYFDDIVQLIDNQKYVKENTISINRTNMPEIMVPVMPKKKKSS